jgi:hypothetical protein
MLPISGQAFPDERIIPGQPGTKKQNFRELILG